MLLIYIYIYIYSYRCFRLSSKTFVSCLFCVGVVKKFLENSMDVTVSSRFRRGIRYCMCRDVDWDTYLLVKWTLEEIASLRNGFLLSMAESCTVLGRVQGRLDGAGRVAPDTARNAAPSSPPQAGPSRPQKRGGAGGDSEPPSKRSRSVEPDSDSSSSCTRARGQQQRKVVGRRASERKGVGKREMGCIDKDNVVGNISGDRLLRQGRRAPERYMEPSLADWGPSGLQTLIVDDSVPVRPDEGPRMSTCMWCDCELTATVPNTLEEPALCHLCGVYHARKVHFFCICLLIECNVDSVV